mgnify:CR=1 FL=1
MSWTNAAITAEGHALQAALVGTGKGLVFTRAASGAGLAAGTLEEQTAVTDERQALSLQPAQVLEGAKVRVRAVLVNTGLSAGYTMRQLGFYARAEDSGDEVLYALVQDEAGDPIPAAAESPGFSVDWTYVFSFGGAAEVTVELDPAGVIGWGAVGQPDGVAGLGPDGKVPEEQMPEMDYVPAGSAAPIEGLPTNDVRTGTVRDGQSIAAGDVVNVQDGEIYRDVVAQKNVETVLLSVGTSSCACDTFPDGVILASLTRSSDNGPTTWLLDSDGRIITSIAGESNDRKTRQVFCLSNTLCGILNRLSDNRVTVQYLTRNGNSLSVKNTFLVIADTANTDAVAVSLSPLTHLLISGSATSLSVMIRDTDKNQSISAGTLNVNVYSSSLSATRIPDDDNGNKRACIFFSDAGDGIKGKAVIVTIDSSNAVTFGEVATIINSTAHHVQCTYSNGVIYALSQTTLYVFNEALSVLGNAGLYGSGTSGADTALIGLPTGVVAVNGSTNYNAVFATWNGTSIEHGSPYKFNIGNPSNYVSGTRISDNEILLAYADTGNSNYGTTTILEISGDQIAGSFLDNSKDAIALESGKGGDTIKLGFGGYCACEGVTAGQTIDSEGVTAYSPLDGWLEIKDQWAKGYVTGEYTGNGTYGAGNPTVIDVGFRPQCLIIEVVSAGSATGVVFIALNGVNVSYSLPTSAAVTISFDKTQVSFYSVSASGQMNLSGAVYRYIAWR